MIETHANIESGDRLAVRTFAELLQYRAAHHPEGWAYSFLPDDSELECDFTYGQLHAKALEIGAELQRRLVPGDRAILLLPTCFEFVAAFFACLYAGIIAVPANVHLHGRMSAQAQRLQALSSDAGAAAVITLQSWTERGKKALGESGYQWISADALEPSHFRCVPEPPRESDIALLQYTSGSTSSPKGVMVTHRNLMHNAFCNMSMFPTSPGPLVGWLPLYHDMGLVGCMLQPLYRGQAAVLMSPVSFLYYPLRWLRTISRFRASQSGGPDFAYRLCVERIPPERRKGLDLSSWKVAFNGSEPVRAETLDLFTAAFEECGFQRSTFYPCYGLAEATLSVSGTKKEMEPRVESIGMAALESGQVNVATKPEAGSRKIAASGHVNAQMRVAIVDPKSQQECSSREIGEIWVAGESVADGYWKRSEDTEKVFHARLPQYPGMLFMRTGDLGFLSEDHLFVSGRLKDLIVIGGKNHYPQDLELTAQNAHPALRNGVIGAFSIEDPPGDEVLVILAELNIKAAERAATGGVEEIRRSVMRAIAEEHELNCRTVELVESGTLPRTSSGKLQRFGCRELYLKGSLRQPDCEIAYAD